MDIPGKLRSIRRRLFDAVSWRRSLLERVPSDDDPAATIQVIRRHVGAAVDQRAVTQAARAILSILDLTGRYASGLTGSPRGAVRRDELQRLSRLAHRLMEGVDRLGEIDTGDILRAGADGAANRSTNCNLIDDRAAQTHASLQGLRLHAVAEARALKVLLEAFANGARAEAEAEAVRAAGRYERSDDHAFAIESLAAVWHDVLGGTVNLSRNQGGFVCFAFELLGPLLQMSESSVRHTVEEMLDQKPKPA